MSRPTHKRKSPGRNSLPWQHRKNRNKRVCSDKRKTKGRQREDKGNRIRQDPTTSASSSSPTDLERLDANVSSRDGLRKPPLTSSGHKCPPSESLRDKRKPCLNTGTTHWDRQIRPHSPNNTLPEPPPDSSPLPYPPEGVATTTKPPKA